MHSGYVELGGYENAQLDSFFTVEQRRLAANTFGSSDLDDELAGFCREAADLVQTILGTPLFVVDVVDHYPINTEYWTLSAPTSDPDDHSLITAAPAVSLDTKESGVQTVAADDLNIDYLAPQTIISYRGESMPELNKYARYPVRISYRGGYVITNDRLDLIKSQFRIYISNARYQRDQGGQFQMSIKKVIARNIGELQYYGKRGATS